MAETAEVIVTQLSGEVVARIPFDDVVGNLGTTDPYLAEMVPELIPKWNGEPCDFSNIARTIAHYSDPPIDEASIKDVWDTAANESIGGRAFLKLVETAADHKGPVELLVHYHSEDLDAPIVPRVSPDRRRLTKAEMRRYILPVPMWSIHSNRLFDAVVDKPQTYLPYHEYDTEHWRFDLGDVDDLMMPNVDAYLNAAHYTAYMEALKGIRSDPWGSDTGYVAVRNAVDPIANPTVAMAVADVKRNAFDNYKQFVDDVTDETGEGALSGPFIRYALIRYDGSGLTNAAARRIEIEPGLYGEMFVTVHYQSAETGEDLAVGRVTPEDMPRIRAHLNERAQRARAERQLMARYVNTFRDVAGDRAAQP